jgi:hypothetical protein
MAATAVSPHIIGAIMTILNGRVVGVDESEFELRTGGDEEPAGGKIRTASPEAVARFKAFLAAQPAKQAPVSRPGVDPDARRRANEMAVRIRAKKLEEMNKQTAPAVKPEEPKEQEMKSALSDEEVVAVHRRYVLENLAVSVLADEIALSESALVNQFNRLRLPCRARNRRWVSAADVDRICQTHGLKIRDIPVRAMPVVEPAAKPKKAKPVKAVVKETPVVPEPVMETAVTPANGAAMTETEIEDQLRAIQQLMSMIGKVENVRVSGTMRIDLHAEVVF